MDKDRFDAHMQLANFDREVRDGSRLFEWGVTFALWAAAGGAMAAGLRGVSYLILIPAGLIIIGVHLYWVSWNYQSTERRAARMYFHRSRAVDYLDEDTQEPKIIAPDPQQQLGRKFWDFSKHTPAALQCIATIVLVGISILVIAN